ncbi:MAG: outer membrane beta-barrel protein, partial [Pseudomonadota bacterium]
MPTDSDVDGIGDWRELDSNSDGTNDIVGTDFESLDTDGNGTVDDPADADNDGIADGVDQLDGFGTAPDTDRDGILDDEEGTADTDNDGLPDFNDTDSDNDGIPDSVEAGIDPLNPVDTDGDGIDDYKDLDSDNDGISDELEGTNDFDNDGVPDYIDVDGQLETAVTGSGGGALGVITLLLLLAVAASRRVQSRAGYVAAILCVGVLANPSGTAVADERCGVLPGNPDDFVACWYGGVGLGYSYVAPEKEAQNFLLDKSEDQDSGFHALVGRQLTPRWFAELKYADLGEAGITNRNPAIAAAFPNAAITYKVPSLMAGYQWRIEEQWKPFVKIGLSAISNDAKGGPIPFEKQTSVQLALGAGVRLDFDDSRWFLRGDFDRYDRDAWYAHVSVGMYFGGKERTLPTPPPRPADLDRDGVGDDVDQCLETPANTPVDAYGCALPVAVVPEGPKDSDGDGVMDGDDQCPDTSAGVEVDVRGCEVKDEIELPGVQFETNSDRLRSGAERVLDDAAQTLVRNPGLKVEVAGHTDDRGDAEYNRGLSERLAVASIRKVIRIRATVNQVVKDGLGASL